MSLEFEAAVDDRGVSAAFRVATGETLALLGPNGAGKSTLLSVLAGVLVPDRADVVLDGQVLDRAGPGVRRVARAPHRRSIALLAQEALLFPHLSVLDNVAFGPRSRGSGRRAAHVRAREWLAAVEAGDLEARRPASLSGGQAQRVALARALAGDPDLLLLDEPLAALDVGVALRLRQTLRRVLGDRTAVIVTHDVLDALLLSDRVLVLDRGRVVEQGPTDEVLTRPRSAFAARIAGLNLVTGVWAGDHVVPDADGPVRDPVRGMTGDEPPAVGAPTVAVFRPSTVSVFTSAPQGSPRNVFEVVVTEVEPLGDLVRLRAGPLSADVTAPAAAELDLVPGSRVSFSVKAAEVSVYPL